MHPDTVVISTFPFSVDAFKHTDKFPPPPPFVVVAVVVVDAIGFMSNDCLFAALKETVLLMIFTLSLIFSLCACMTCSIYNKCKISCLSVTS